MPEACSRTWRDVTLEERRLIGYRNRYITLGAQAVRAVAELDEHTPPRLAGTRLLWKADTASRWLKPVVKPQSVNSYCDCFPPYRISERHAMKDAQVYACKRCGTSVTLMIQPISVRCLRCGRVMKQHRALSTL
jgi:DNA-directed RNA polymerase subunit RPC12/RpoP